MHELRRTTQDPPAVVTVTAHDAGAFDWHDLLPSSCRDPAYLFGNEYAWPWDMAIEVISLLERHSRRVIGVDPWIPTRPGPTPISYDWDEHRHIRFPSFGRTPSEFVRAFSWSLAFSWSPMKIDEPELQPYFNLTVE